MATSAGAPCAGPGSVGRIWPTVLAVFDSFFSSPWSRFSQGLLWEPFLTSVRFTGALLGFRVWPFPQQHQMCLSTVNRGGQEVGQVQAKQGGFNFCFLIRLCISSSWEQLLFLSLRCAVRGMTELQVQRLRALPVCAVLGKCHTQPSLGSSLQSRPVEMARGAH